jgi:RNA-dependent RNA polymerase
MLVQVKTNVLRFTTILDGAKTGKMISPDAYRRDQKIFGGRKPKWNESEEEARRFDERNLRYPKRPAHLGDFVMDMMREEVGRLVGSKLTEINSILEQEDRRPDETLLAPYTDVMERIKHSSASEDPDEKAVGRCLDREVTALRGQVEKIHHEWVKTIQTASGSEVSFTGRPIGERQDRLRKLSQKFAFDPPDTKFNVLSAKDRMRIKASYAYTKCPTVRFPWDVSMHILCQVKSSASDGSCKSIIHGFYYHFKLVRDRFL